MLDGTSSRDYHGYPRPLAEPRKDTHSSRPVLPGHPRQPLWPSGTGRPCDPQGTFSLSMIPTLNGFDGKLWPSWSGRNTQTALPSNSLSIYPHGLHQKSASFSGMTEEKTMKQHGRRVALSPALTLPFHLLKRKLLLGRAAGRCFPTFRRGDFLRCAVSLACFLGTQDARRSWVVAEWAGA